MGELQTVSNGVGYTIPFELIGAPWIEAHKLADTLNKLYRYVPSYGSSSRRRIQTTAFVADERLNALVVFANRGELIQPAFITKIEDRFGNILEEMSPARKRVVDETTAYIMTSLLEGVVKFGTARRIRALNRQVAGKTGTTNNLFDAWFVGYTPEMVAGVWVGFPEGRVPMEYPATPYTIAGGTWPRHSAQIENGRVAANITYSRIGRPKR